MFWQKIVVCFLITSIYLLFPHRTWAVQYKIIPPSQEITQGQNVDFNISIDTEGTTVTSAITGINYYTNYLQYLYTTPGPAIDSVTVNPDTPGVLVLTATNTNGFNGSNVLATVTFKVVTQPPGNTQLCFLFTPTITPSPATTNTVIITPTSTNTINTTTPFPPSPTPTTKKPTQLPHSGFVDTLNIVTTFAVVLLISAVIVLIRV